VNVLSKPGHPEGPLDVSDVTADSMTLGWKPPMDDGGMPIDFYEVEKMDTATGRWMPCGRSDGTQFVAKNLTPGHEYHFRVKAVNKEGESDPLQTKDPILAKNPYDVPAKMERPDLVDWDKDHVDLAWKTPADGGAPIEAYVIEKRDNEVGGKWVEALQVPAGQNSATVPGLRAGSEYQFRIAAKNKAGLGEPSDPTEPVIAKSRKLAPRIHREDLQDVVVKVGGDVKFNVHVDGEPPPTVTWSFNDGTTPDAVSVQNQDYLSKFALMKAKRANAGRYTITAKNAHGTDSVTVTVAVKGRPSPPKGPLEVSDVFEDRVTLDWKPPEDDGGEPISHYEVERQDARDGIWVPAGTSASPHFVADNLTKGQNYKFRVRAVNAEGKSDPLETTSAVTAKNPYDRPDKPNPPELVDWDSDHVDLKWVPPASDGGAPIQEYQVLKLNRV
jgi:predicted phage tail protein